MFSSVFYKKNIKLKSFLKDKMGHPRAPAPSMLYPASDIDWRFNSYMIVYMLECHSPKSSQLLPPSESKSPLYTAVSFFLSCIQGRHCHLSKFHIYVWFPLEFIGLTSLQSKGLWSLLQHHNLKASVLWHSTFFTVKLLHLYMLLEKS